MKNTSYVEYIVHDVLHFVPNVTYKAMFGGFSLYSYGHIFAIITGEELYIKGFPETVSALLDAGFTKFLFTQKSGKEVGMNYFKVPANILECEPELRDWVEQVLAKI